MKRLTTAVATVAVLALTACDQPHPRQDSVAADEAATQTPQTAPPGSPAQATQADRAAAKQAG